MREVLEKCNENTIAALIKHPFEFSSFAIHKNTFKKVGIFDENCIDAYCEDYDYKQRCYLNSIKIESLDKSLERFKLVLTSLKFLQLSILVIT